MAVSIVLYSEYSVTEYQCMNIYCITVVLGSEIINGLYVLQPYRQLHDMAIMHHVRQEMRTSMSTAPQLTLHVF